MNKKLKNFFTLKNCFIFLVVSIVIYMSVSFFNITKEAKKDIVNVKDMQFSKYDSFNDNLLYLYKIDNEFVITDSEKEELYRTDEHVSDFILLDEENILISILAENTFNSDLVYSVKKVNLKTLNSEEIYNLNGDISIFNKDSNAVIVNTELQKAFEFGTKTLTHNFPKNFDKVFSSNNEIFAVYYYVENENIQSYVYGYTEEGFKELFIFPGKISFISTDFNNSNKIYITYTSNTNPNPTVPIVCEKYLVNLSNNNNGEKIYPHLTGRILSGANGIYLLNTETKVLSVLNSDLSIKSIATHIHNELPLSMAKIDKKSGTLYCVDNGYLIRKDIVENEAKK